MKGLEELEHDPLITMIVLDKRLDYLEKRMVPIPRQLENLKDRMNANIKQADELISNIRQFYPELSSY